MISIDSNLSRLVGLFALTAALTACGGGGGGSAQIAVTPASTPVPSPTPAPSPAPSPTPPATVGNTGARPDITAADCPRLMSTAIPTPLISDKTMQFTSDVLFATDQNSGYPLFARLPGYMSYWINTDTAVTSDSISLGVHETTHFFNDAISRVCSSDLLRRFHLLGSVYTSNLPVITDTAKYSIVSEVFPEFLKNTTAGSNYFVYIITNGSNSANGLNMVLDELTAYTNGTQVEVNIAASPAYNYLSPIARSTVFAFNPRGIADFMSYTVAYLRAARLNHPTTYASLQGQAATLAYLQTLWTAAEQQLARAYPYSTTATGSYGFMIPLPALAWTYAPDQLVELDMLGIRHASSTVWNATYLK